MNWELLHLYYTVGSMSQCKPRKDDLIRESGGLLVLMNVFMFLFILLAFLASHAFFVPICEDHSTCVAE